MSKIFDTQTYLQIRCSFTADVASHISSVLIKYEKPDGTTGSFTGTLDEANKRVTYNLTAGNPLEDLKRWKFWLGATMDDGRYLPSEVDTYIISEEGERR